jgi:GlpG protein
MCQFGPSQVRRLASNSDETFAEALSALLEVNEIQSEVRSSGGEFAVWVHADDDLPRARELLATFQPEEAAKLTSEAKKIRLAREKKRRPVAVARRVRVSGQSPIGAGVAVLVGISALVAVVYRLGFAPPLGIVPLAPGGEYFRAGIDWTEPWRLVTPMFIHFGLFHVAFNMIWLRRLGAQIEENHGTVSFLLLVLGSSALSNYAQYELSGPLFGGMSGVNYALFGFGWMNTRYGPPGAYSVTQSDAVWLMGWLVLCATGLMGPVANAAHAVGLMCGTALGLPAYVNYRKTFRVKTAFEKGSWEDLNIKGWARFRRLYVEPYLPGWVLLIALAVLWLDY